MRQQSHTAAAFLQTAEEIGYPVIVRPAYTLGGSGGGITENADELAAIARVCERSGVKCLSVKCISDTFDGNGADFAVNVKKSAEKAFAALRKVLKAL